MKLLRFECFFSDKLVKLPLSLGHCKPIRKNQAVGYQLYFYAENSYFNNNNKPSDMNEPHKKIILQGNKYLREDKSSETHLKHKQKPCS